MKLNKCKHCNGEPVPTNPFRMPGSPQQGAFRVECKDCGKFVSGKTIKEAKEIWNEEMLCPQSTSNSDLTPLPDPNSTGTSSVDGMIQE